MPLLKLTGKEAVLNIHFEHAFHLEDGMEYWLALVGFYSDNNIINLKNESVISFQYPQLKGKVTTNVIHTLTFEKGFWTLEKLQSKCRNFLQGLLETRTVNNIDPNSLQLSKQNDKVGIFSPLGFYLDSSMRHLLGFELDSYYDANVNQVGTKIPKLRAVDVLEIHCDIIETSFIQHQSDKHKHNEAPILYTFFPNVPHGYKISEIPNERLYLRVKHGLQKLQNITIKITDQEGFLIQNDDVNNVVYLELIMRKK